MNMLRLGGRNHIPVQGFEEAQLLSWHIADELMPKLTAKGFKGKFIIPLPTPRVVNGSHG